MNIEEYVEQTIVKLREANLLLNKIYEKRFICKRSSR